MQSDEANKFRRSVKASENLPNWIRDAVESSEAIETRVFDETYLRFLDEQIKLAPRGPQLTAILKKRRDALTGFCGKSLLRGIIQTGNKRCSIEIDPNSETVIHWELYTAEPADTSK